jgi:hypothetical protein
MASGSLTEKIVFFIKKGFSTVWRKEGFFYSGLVEIVKDAKWLVELCPIYESVSNKMATLTFHSQEM